MNAARERTAGALSLWPDPPFQVALIEPAGVILSPLGLSDRVLLNGTPIGATGSTGPNFVAPVSVYHGYTLLPDARFARQTLQLRIYHHSRCDFGPRALKIVALAAEKDPGFWEWAAKWAEEQKAKPKPKPPLPPEVKGRIQLGALSTGPHPA